MSRFTHLIRKVFLVKILLYGKFLLFLTLVEPAVVYFLVLVTGVPLRCGNVAYHGVFRMLLCLSAGIGSLLIGISGRVGSLNMLLCLYCDDVTH